MELFSKRNTESEKTNNEQNTKIRIWNILSEIYFRGIDNTLPITFLNSYDLFKKIWQEIFILPTDGMPEFQGNFRNEFREKFLKSDPEKIFDIIEFILQEDQTNRPTIIKECNQAFEKENVPYQIKENFTIQNMNTIEIKNISGEKIKNLTLIGEGSYAKVFKFKDDFYNKTFALKRAEKNLSNEELKRFEKEYEIMEKLNSLYITEVFRYDQDKNEYIMEYLDYDLEKFLKKHNSTIEFSLRKNIGNQVLKAFLYIHKEGYLHRDISPNNILLKEFDDCFIVKISDFGLVKEPQSVLTKTSTELKGRFNDPSLASEGFKNYEEAHEIYALTKLLYFILTGKVNLDTKKIKNQKLRKFVEKGMNADKTKRFQSVEKMKEEFLLIEE